MFKKVFAEVILGVLFLTSSLDCSEKDEFGNKIPHQFPNINYIHENLKKYLQHYNNFLFVASSFETEITDMYANVVFKSFDLTMPFKKYEILDMRTKDRAADLINQADFIFLCGGHLPTQNKLFNALNLRELIKNTSAVICGSSAGSMNAAAIVYCPPEIQGEASDVNFRRYLTGLGLTEINIYPHWNESLIETEFLDGKNIYREIMLPDSKNKPFIAFDDGTYILQVDGKPQLFGSAYIFKDGSVKQFDCTKDDLLRL